MSKEVIFISLAFFVCSSAAFVNREDVMRQRPETGIRSNAVLENCSMNGFQKGDAMFEGNLSGSFDKAGLGLGWNLGDQRRVQTYYPPGFESDPGNTPPIISCIYRKLWPSGYGTIGGAMIE